MDQDALRTALTDLLSDPDTARNVLAGVIGFASGIAGGVARWAGGLIVAALWAATCCMTSFGWSVVSWPFKGKPKPEPSELLRHILQMVSEWPTQIVMQSGHEHLIGDTLCIRLGGAKDVGNWPAIKLGSKGMEKAADPDLDAEEFAAVMQAAKHVAQNIKDAEREKRRSELAIAVSQGGAPQGNQIADPDVQTRAAGVLRNLRDRKGGLNNGNGRVRAATA